MEQQDEVIVPATLDEDGVRVHTATMTPTSDVRCKVVNAKLQGVVPVVFVPGIMGSNLRFIEGKKAAWRPPNASLSLSGVFQLLSAMVTWIPKGPQQRQKILNPAVVEPDPDGPIDVGNSGLTEKIARQRGWGTVMSSAYHGVMITLQRDLNAMVERGEITDWWRDHGLLPPAEFGEETGQTELTCKELEHARNYRFEVWGGGYNWLQSNRDSGKQLRDWIANTVLPFYREKNQVAEKVILVTHSMGGLVARGVRLAEREAGIGPDASVVLGVAQGVEPSTGSPAIYHHCRCGYEGPAQLILGRNAREVTAVVANAPGALELAPSMKYGTDWLEVRSEAGVALRKLPVSDPFEEIYKSTEWYGLVPAFNTKYLDLSTNVGDTKDVGYEESRTNYNEALDRVSEFQQMIGDGYFQHTHVHFGDDDGERSYERAIWQGDVPSIEAGARITPLSDDHNGRIRVNDNSRAEVRFQKASGPGDGTVPTRSGTAPKGENIRSRFRHGRNGRGAHNLNRKSKPDGYEHQPSYNDPRAQWATLYGIVKLVQEAKWHGKV